MHLAYSCSSALLLLAFIACPNVAEYSNEKPCSHSLRRASIHRPASLPLEPRWPSSTRTRLLPSKASMATVFSPMSSRSLWMSMISIVLPANSDLPSFEKRSASIPAAWNSTRCCFDRPSFGVSRMIRFSSRSSAVQLQGNAGTGGC